MSGWHCGAGVIHMPFTSWAELSSTPVLTLEPNRALIEKYDRIKKGNRLCWGLGR